MKVLTLIKAKSNVFLWYVQCYSCTLRSKTKILTTRAPCFRLCNTTWIDYARLSNDFSGFYKRSVDAGTWKSTMTSHIQDVAFDVVTSNSIQDFGFRSSRAATELHVSKKNISFSFNQGYYFHMKKGNFRLQFPFKKASIDFVQANWFICFQGS